MAKQIRYKAGTVECKECHVRQTRLLSGATRSDGRNIFVNAEGKRWSGNTCPTCLVKFVVPKVRYRFCKKCKVRLSQARYFYCINCKPVLDDDIGLEESYVAW